MTDRKALSWRAFRLTTLWHILAVFWLAANFAFFEFPSRWLFGLTLAWCVGNLLFLAAAAWCAARREAKLSSVIYVVLLVATWYTAPVLLDVLEFSSVITFRVFIMNVLPKSAQEAWWSLVWAFLHIGYYVVMRKQFTPSYTARKDATP